MSDCGDEGEGRPLSPASPKSYLHEGTSSSDLSDEPGSSDRAVDYGRNATTTGSPETSFTREPDKENTKSDSSEDGTECCMVEIIDLSLDSVFLPYLDPIQPETETSSTSSSSEGHTFSYTEQTELFKIRLCEPVFMEPVLSEDDTELIKVPAQNLDPIQVPEAEICSTSGTTGRLVPPLMMKPRTKRRKVLKKCKRRKSARIPLRTGLTSALRSVPTSDSVLGQVEERYKFPLMLGTINTEPGLSENAVVRKEQPRVVHDPSHFTPEISINNSGETSYRFRVEHPGSYQCALTQLVFTMIREGELSYRIIQWDESLLQSSGKTPAGPLFNIQCSEDAVCQLHLPHCETEPAPLTGGLSVVHFSDVGMSILEPQQITDTHVVVDVPDLSAFGLVWDFIKRFLNIHRPIRGQVLLFHRPMRNRKLNVFLLPENIPLQEVKGQQKGAEYIEAPSSCLLSTGHTYSVYSPEAYRVQPVCAQFDISYGPNYHPTFEIRQTLSTEEATVTVRDQEKTPVWEYHVEFTAVSASSAPSTSAAYEPDSLPVPAGGGGGGGGGGGPGPGLQNLPRTESLQGEEEKKLFSVRTEFIDRVSGSVLKDLLDTLLENRVINSRELESIEAQPRADKARELIDTVLRKGNSACNLLVDALCELDPFVSKTLQLN